MDIIYTLEQAKANAAKHGIGFAEAATVFDDPIRLLEPDRDKSGAPFRAIGFSSTEPIRQCLVLLLQTERIGSQNGHDINAIRILGARLASQHEREMYALEQPIA